LKRIRSLSLISIVLLVLAVTAALHAGPAYGTTVPPTSTPGGSETGGDGSGSEVSPELPAPDLPSSNAQGYTFDLKYANSADFEGLPREASVYELKREKPTQKDVQALATRLGVTGDVADRGDGTFEAEGNGKLYVSIDQTVYTSEADAGEGKLQSDEKAISQARDWLRKTTLLPPDLGDGEIQARLDDSERLIVQFGPVEPTDVLSGYPSITITVGASGEVLEAQIRWANIVRADVYQLMSADEAWQLVSSGQVFLDADLSGAKIDSGTNIKGRVTFSSVSIAYATAGPPGGSQYLEPVYAFEGRIRPDGDNHTYPVKAYVSALSNSGAPVG
jgi:hypothetical protein